MVVFDKSGEVDEAVLLDIIDDAIASYPEVKVWNLSLSQPSIVCTDSGFSPLAIALDFRARTHGIQFVVTGGNLPNTVAPRHWPRRHHYDESDERSCAPGDSVRAIHVGGITHRDSPATIAKVGDPSPIARRGPGGGYLLAPLVAGYSGNCDSAGNFTQTGVLSSDANGNLSESIGVSFALPPVSSLVATVEDAVRKGGNARSVLLAKAMLYHSAFLKNAPLDAALVNYKGLGPVPSLDDVLYCDQAAPTVVFEALFDDLPQMCKRVFPLPKSAIVGKALQCEILMTLLYDPPLDGEYGVQYVRSNIDAQLGCRSGKKMEFGTRVYPHLRFLEEGSKHFEKDLIRQGFKWSPVKFYYENFYDHPSNELGTNPWELRLKLFRRAEHIRVEPQPAFLFITIRDRDGTSQLYNDWIVQMAQQAWNVNDLSVQSRIRSR